MRGLWPSFLVKNPRFQHFLGAITISFIGSSIFDIAMPIYVLQRTDSVVLMSLVSVALHLPHFVMAPVNGFLADHSNRRRLLLSCDMGQIFLMLLTLLYHESGITTVWPLLLLVLVNKSLMILFETVANFQLIPALVPPHSLAEANTWFLSFHRVIQIVGPLLGGFLLTFWGPAACIIANIVSFAATLWFVYGFTNLNAVVAGGLEDEIHPPLTAGNLYRNFSENLLYIWHSPVFRPFVIVMFLWNLSPLTLNSPSLIYYFTGLHKYSPAEYGAVVALFGALGILGYVVSGRVYAALSFKSAFGGSAYWQAILATIGVLGLPWPGVLAIFYAASRVASSIMSMGSFILRQTAVPRESAGGVNAALRMLFMSAAPLSSFLQGRTIELFGVEITLVLGAACLWGTVWYSSKLARALSENPTEGDAIKSVVNY